MMVAANLLFFTKLYKTKSLLVHHPFTSKSSYSLLIHYYYSLFYILWFFVTCAEHSRCDFLFLVIFIPFKIILVEIHSQEKLLLYWLSQTNLLLYQRLPERCSAGSKWDGTYLLNKNLLKFFLNLLLTPKLKRRSKCFPFLPIVCSSCLTRYRSWFTWPNVEDICKISVSLVRIPLSFIHGPSNIAVPYLSIIKCTREAKKMWYNFIRSQNPCNGNALFQALSTLDNQALSNNPSKKGFK